ncbi:Spy/CpxP family protein refolding chaperone [Pseudomonas sp. Marseille-Q5115]|uniref:Spy/CpxP family protein refolding chaperone n=1 Tax=Pseudomonas sp. Marseille-Q5115 TaxID=2866593 RepID=UPI001CE494F8|nr:Spy/CpxP family protein refolding chaperone [Pseudomonas sp. Marseille-Q5115]
MRKTLTALLFAATLPTLAMAAPEGPVHGPDMGQGAGPGMMHHRGPGPLEGLDLSREQRQQVGKLMGEQMKQRREITETYLDKLPAAEKKAMHDALAASEAKTRSDIRAVLKPEQQKEFDEMNKKRDERRAEWAEFQAWKAQKDKKAQ